MSTNCPVVSSAALQHFSQRSNRRKRTSRTNPFRINTCRNGKHTTLTIFRINTCKSVSKQRTLTSFRMNTYEKHTGGWVLWLTRCLEGDFQPEGAPQGGIS